MVPRRSPLHDAHVAAGARLAEFGGWEMPISYPTGTVAEHRACRTEAAIFDVSHLGTVRLEDPSALDLLQATFTNDLGKVGPGRAQYTHLLTDEGWVADDVIVWWVAEARFDVMPNASNTERVRAAVGGEDVTETRAVIAVQGPHARACLSKVSPEAASVGRFRVASVEWEGVPCTVAGTGYTGEDGVECALPAEAAPRFWEAVTGAGATPAGLGARDTLRLEAGLPLHGHELGEGITPLQAGLEWVVAWEKGPFKGRDALAAERSRGPSRRLRGLRFATRQPARDGDLLTAGGSPAGRVTSGNFSPMLECAIALAFIDTAASVGDGDEVIAEVRGRQLKATVGPVRAWPPPGAREVGATA